jgi:hypothetical protein
MVNDRLRRLKTGAIDETKKLFGIFIYLWVLLSLFSFHKALVLNEEYLLYDQWFALINALVLAKVVLIGEFFRVGDKLTNRPLIYPIIFKSAVFAVLLICFHIIEKTLTGVPRKRPLRRANCPVWPAFAHGGSAPLQQSRRKSAQAVARHEHIGVLVQQCDHEHLVGVVATCRCG